MNIVKRLLDIQQPELLKVDAVIKVDRNDEAWETTVDILHYGACTAFHIACAMGHHDVVQLLLELPAGTINFEATMLSFAFTGVHFTGFSQACFWGCLTVVNLLLQLPEGVINIQAKGDLGWNGFMFA